ncbi:MAG: BREX-4 system phosphatase PglZ, partial [Prevotellaceae bacterium]|nr:BREX-4 system phosphatase PglZ [Prevotellaceae bacterium]
MTAAEKIKIFKSVEALIAEIKTDCSSNDILKNRYAVRFIMIDNFNVFQELSLQLAAANVDTFGLETLLSYDNKDRWITQDELKNCIKQIGSCTIVSPFSEIVRFYNEEKFTTFFNEIALLENPQDKLNRRIYIPLIGLESRFVKFLSSLGRIEESAPIWAVKTGVSQPVTIYLTPSADSTKGYNFPKIYRGLETMYDWLLFWKTKAPTEKIICSSLPINVNYKYSQPDNIFDIKPIETAFEFITQFLKIQINIEYKASDEYFWIQLLFLIDCKKGNAFS